MTLSEPMVSYIGRTCLSLATSYGLPTIFLISSRSEGFAAMGAAGAFLMLIGLAFIVNIYALSYGFANRNQCTPKFLYYFLLLINLSPYGVILGRLIYVQRHPPPRSAMIGLTPRSTRTPPALSSALSQLLASSASFSASVQAGPVSFLR